jgi:hypothetical protein
MVHSLEWHDATEVKYSSEVRSRIGFHKPHENHICLVALSVRGEKVN